jgi:hypothetical protein
MLRCGSFIGLSSATALRGRRGRFGGPRRPLSGKDHNVRIVPGRQESTCRDRRGSIDQNRLSRACLKSPALETTLKTAGVHDLKELAGG